MIKVSASEARVSSRSVLTLGIYPKSKNFTFSLYFTDCLLRRLEPYLSPEGRQAHGGVDIEPAVDPGQPEEHVPQDAPLVVGQHEQQLGEEAADEVAVPAVGALLPQTRRVVALPGE